MDVYLETYGERTEKREKTQHLQLDLNDNWGHIYPNCPDTGRSQHCCIQQEEQEKAQAQVYQLLPV